MERPRQLFFQLYDALVSFGYEITAENPQNLNILRERPDDPAVIYFNHATKDDPFLIADVLHKFAPDRLANVIVPVSHHHLQIKNAPDYALTVPILGRGLAGFNMPPVVQGYRRRSDFVPDGLEEAAFKMNLHLARTLRAILPTGPLLVISPEGHRSDSRFLHPAEGGIAEMARMMVRLIHQGKIQNAHFIPLGLVFDNHQGPKKLHFNLINRSSVRVVIGPPQDVGSLLSQSRGRFAGANTNAPGHYLMERLATLLPEDMHGFYAKEKIADTYAERYESRLGADNKVCVWDKLEKKSIRID